MKNCLPVMSHFNADKIKQEINNFLLDFFQTLYCSALSLDKAELEFKAFNLLVNPQYIPTDK